MRHLRTSYLVLTLAFLAASIPVFADPQNDLSNLFQQVNTVAGNNGFTQGERVSLATKLIGAIEALRKGHENTASNHLGAFINEVEALERSGRISSPEADALIGSADAIIGQL